MLNAIALLLRCHDNGASNSSVVSHYFHCIQGKVPGIFVLDLAARFFVFFLGDFFGCGFFRFGFFCFRFEGCLAIVFCLPYSIISTSAAELNPA
jgi:hypothetical protein